MSINLFSIEKRVAMTAAARQGGAEAAARLKNAELAAEKVLVAAGVLHRATTRKRPAAVARQLREMLQQVPAIEQVMLLKDSELAAQCKALATAYETGDADRAKAANQWIEKFLHPLCH